MVYGLGRIDASGRVADRTVTGALGWRDGDRLTLTASAGVVTTRRDPDGLVILPPRPYIVIPATLRHRCGLLQVAGQVPCELGGPLAGRVPGDAEQVHAPCLDFDSERDV